MAKPNPLSQGLSRQSRIVDPVASPIAESPQPITVRSLPPSRVGRVLIGGHFAPEVQTALKIIAAEERTSVQALLTEGINAVLASRHKPQIAALSIPFGKKS